ncbi:MULTISPECIES: patatin-like phospholipase family protein [Rhodomicrobium]|uniref:patatin-like phospholipase family protein n=1 Tax=Rhodomicrobium TaxID=1068 RepID=UPI000B4BCF8D|nr:MULTISPECIES: patatin-like phospholipase family protein [Rhodomicrobium]
MERNKIGIALGGGAARGWAHIGVLKALLQSGLKPTVIAGTSIGAVVGGCHAAGKLDHLEDFVSQLTPRGVLRFLDLDITGGGLMSGTRLSRTLDTELAGMQIEDLTNTFVAVATEIGSGREIWLTKGPLVAAIRASYALPGIFRPIQINGRWLMDGAFVNPVPVAVCRAMGANFVIAVNLHHGGVSRTALTPMQATSLETVAPEPVPARPVKKRRIPMLRNIFNKGNGNSAPGISRVLLEAFNVTQDRIARARLAGDPPDIIIAPRLGGMGLFDFHKSKIAIAEGYEATMRQLEEIEQTSNALGY